MKSYSKRDFPVSQSRQLLEPGPITLISSRWKNETNIMTMGWQTVMEFTPALMTCCISNGNHSFELVRKSKECVINLPTVDLAKQVVGIGNSSGAEIDKFEKFQLTAVPASRVKAPLIKECYANFECKLVDSRLIKTYNFFIFEIVKAHVAVSPRHPKTLHYRGNGEFMVAGSSLNMRRYFLPQNL